MWDILPSANEVATLSGSNLYLRGKTLVFPAEAKKEIQQIRKKSSQPSGRLFIRKDRLIQSFILIASLEIGQGLLLKKERLMDHIFAISIDDSLYIASPLVSDPAQGFRLRIEIRRVRGNIGRPGLNLLGFFSPPDAVRVREKEPGRWKLINHHEFDGRLEDMFSRTSLHLTLTGYVHDITIQGGSSFSHASFAEAVVSSHDAGDWVADLDLLNETLLERLIYIKAWGKCRGRSEAGKPPGKQLLTIENWEELLDPPQAPAVFRAHGNWQARLAATFICLRNGYLTLLFGSHGCWDCAFKHLSRAEPDVILCPIRPKSQSRGNHGREQLEPFHPIISGLGFEQGTDVPDKDQDIPDLEPLKEDSSSDLAEPVFPYQYEISVKQSNSSKENGEATVIDNASALNANMASVEAGLEAEGGYILSEGSSNENERVPGSRDFENEDEDDVESQESAREDKEWPRDRGPRPIVFIL